MIELAASVSTPPIGCAIAPPGGTGTDDFLTLLAGMLGGGESEPALTVVSGKRQAIAGGGKDLPAVAVDEDAPKELSWLPVGLMMSPPPVPVPTALAMLQPRVAVAIGEDGVSPLLVLAKAEAPAGNPVVPSPPSPDWAPASAGVAAVDGVEVAPTTPAAITLPAKEGVPVARTPDVAKDGVLVAHAPDAPQAGAPASRTLEPAKSESPVRTAAIAPTPQQPQLAQPTLTQPAGQAFATAIAAAVQAQSHRERETDARAPIVLASATLEAVHTPAITATPDAKQASLNLRQDSGLQGMIDHIELLRDGADANDTRIRLVPDALGAVDVSVRKDGDRVHVHFNAENAASARLIAEAQPRLADLAEARGVRLGDTSVDSGSGDARRPPAPVPTISTTPVSVTESDDLSTDIRIA